MVAIYFISFPILFCEEKNKTDCEFNTNFSPSKDYEGNKQTTETKQERFLAPGSSQFNTDVS